MEEILNQLFVPTKQMLANLVEIELGYINTGHPEFVGGTSMLMNIMMDEQSREEFRNLLREPNSSSLEQSGQEGEISKPIEKENLQIKEYNDTYHILKTFRINLDEDDEDEDAQSYLPSNLNRKRDHVSSSELDRHNENDIDFKESMEKLDKLAFDKETNKTTTTYKNGHVLDKELQKKLSRMVPAVLHSEYMETQFDRIHLLRVGSNIIKTGLILIASKCD